MDQSGRLLQGLQVGPLLATVSITSEQDAEATEGKRGFVVMKLQHCLAVNFIIHKIKKTTLEMLFFSYI